jgi:signal transduction histidine kinase
MSFLSHDLRGSLNGLLLMSEVLHRELGDYPQFAQSLEDLRILRQSILSTVNVIEQLVLLQRLAQGKVTPRLESVSLRDAARQAAEAAGSQDTPPVQIEIPAEATVPADPLLLVPALQALLDNALRYGDGKPVRISALPTDRGGWTIEIADQGRGMSRQQLNALLYDSDADPAKAGAGLLLVRMVAREVGAVLSAESQPGQGTVFRLTFPAALA